jgi:antirestriction protein ArdC
MEGSKMMNNEKLKGITEKLENGIKALFESEKYKEYLKTLSKFHKYSFNNALLIMLQKPNATYIAGFTTWRDKFKRYVRKDEKGIQIIIPSPYKKMVYKIEEEKEVEEIIPCFKVGYVFDISQTEGADLPLINAEELTTNVDNYNNFYAALEKISPVPVTFEKITTGAKGYYSEEDKRITINESMAELQTLKTFIHEIAHATLHNKNEKNKERKPSRNAQEVEAESIAFTVLSHYGFDTSDYTFPYIAGWGSYDMKELKESLGIIRDTAAEIIDAIDGHFKEVLKAA